MTLRDDSWFENSACRGLDPNLFFPDLDTKHFPDLPFIKNLCRSCPVNVECLDYVLSQKTGEDGYWASTHSQRRKLREFRTDVNLFKGGIDVAMKTLTKFDVAVVS